MFGPSILVRTLSNPVPMHRTRRQRQHELQKDHVAEVASWVVLFDLMRTSWHLRDHIAEGLIALNITRPVRDLRANRKKLLDLIIGRPLSTAPKRASFKTFTDLVERYAINLAPSERRALAKLPVLRQSPVESVMLGLTAKTCLTDHSKALPRVLDDLNAGQQTIHAANEYGIAVGLAIVNLAKTFTVPGRVGYCPHCRQKVTPINKHDQPQDALRVIQKIEELPQRQGTRDSGLDAVALVLVDFRNDGTPAKLISRGPAPRPEEPFHYDHMIAHLTQLYETRFGR